MIDLKFSTEKPKIYDKLHEQFNVSWDDGLIIADGYILCCKYEIPPEKIIHELVHSKRQEKIGKDLWWNLYLSKPTFLLEEEVLAYREEYKFICENIKDRNLRFECLYEMARTLSSEQYGSLVSGDEAVALIQS
jgi:hypothetical protein